MLMHYVPEQKLTLIRSYLKKVSSCRHGHEDLLINCLVAEYMEG